MELRLPPIRDLNLHDDNRPSTTTSPPRDERLQKVLTHCKALCAFADHYASSPPPPNPPEVAQMVDRAVEVITILQDYKQSTFPPVTPAYRPPKRPWEDATDESGYRPAPSPPVDSPSPSDDAPSPSSAFPPTQETHMSVFDGVPQREPVMDEDAKAVAIRDMENIRARRTQGQSTVSGKTKYKKRSRATPPGYCHSCEISDTPEWRRGPDGQRTLCNACGLHYAKLVRKRDRIISALPAGGQAPPPIDINFLRKSARLAAENSALARSAAGRRRGGDKDKPKVESPKRSAPSSTASERTWERDSAAPSQDYSHTTSPSYSAPPMAVSPVRAPVNMPMALPPLSQTRYPTPMNYGPPSYQPFVQSGAPQSSYGTAPPSGWSYDHHQAPAPAPAPHQWDRYMPPHPR